MQFRARTDSLDLQMPRLRCDFNARALSDEPDDECFYSFDRAEVSRLPDLVGMKVVLFDLDSDEEITACEAVVEVYRTGWRGEADASFWFCGFRARPIDASWYWGRRPWN
jgi:hypothetical protein